MRQKLSQSRLRAPAPVLLLSPEAGSGKTHCSSMSSLLRTIAGVCSALRLQFALLSLIWLQAIIPAFCSPSQDQTDASQPVETMPFSPGYEPLPAQASGNSKGVPQATTSGPATDLANFHQITPFLFRGGQPSAGDLVRLKAQGIKTIVNLRNEEILVEREAKVCRQLGLRFINIPLDVFNTPAKNDVRRFLTVVDSADNQPVFVHCLHGQDRTGCLAAIFRIEKQGWDADRAYQEMVSCGFRPGFSHLSDLVFEWGEKAGRPGHKPSGAEIMRDLKKRLPGSIGK